MAARTRRWSGAAAARQRGRAVRMAGADPVSRRAAAHAVQLTQAPMAGMARAASRRAPCRPATLPPLRRALLARAGGAEGARRSRMSSPSLRSMDRPLCCAASLPRSSSPRACRRCLGVLRCRCSALRCLPRPLVRFGLRRANRVKRMRASSRFVDSEPCCQTDSHEARACDAHFPRVAIPRCRGEGSAAGPYACRDVARRQVSRAPRSARRAAARRRCRRRAGGSAGCPRPARRHARPSR